MHEERTMAYLATHKNETAALYCSMGLCIVAFHLPNNN